MDWPSGIDYILSIDENGTPDLKTILHNNEWFTITGVLFDKEQFVKLDRDIAELKLKYWQDSLFNNKVVVLHAREIRKKIGPFNPKILNTQEFNSDLDLLIRRQEYKIFSSSINKERHTTRYVYPYPVYSFCLEFILERYAMYLNDCNKKGLIVIESRGRKENKVLLDSATELLENGNQFVDKERFRCIKGVYFNPKRVGNKVSFSQLELSDLIGYEIYKYVKTDEESLLFQEIKKNLYKYPTYSGYGMKIFPF